MRHRPGRGHGAARRRRVNAIAPGWIATELTRDLVADEDVAETITLFQVNGAMIYVDPDGGVLGYEDVFSKIDLCRAHDAKAGLGGGYVDQFIR